MIGLGEVPAWSGLTARVAAIAVVAGLAASESHNTRSLRRYVAATQGEAIKRLATAAMFLKYIGMAPGRSSPRQT